MFIYTIPKKILRSYLYHKIRSAKQKKVQSLIIKNNFLDRYCEGESEYINKWSVISNDVSPVYYRFFSKYVGCNPNILPGDICINYIEPILNPIRYRDYYEDKNVFGKLFPKEWMPKTFLRRMNGIFMDEDYNTVSVTKDNILKFLGDVDRFILKPSVDSCSGRGVSLFHKEKDSYIDQNGSVFSFDFLISNYGDDFIIQACVEQSDYLSQFNPSSINTIRLTVYRSVRDNQLYITNGIIRIGATKSVVDNAHAGGVFCGINQEGCLSSYVGTSDGATYETFNGINFKDSKYRIPNFNGIKAFALDIAKEIPHHRIIALDIALDKSNNPIFIEHNIGGYGYWVFQMAGQITLDGFTDEIIQYCSEQTTYHRHQILF